MNCKHLKKNRINNILRKPGVIKHFDDIDDN